MIQPRTVFFVLFILFSILPGKGQDNVLDLPVNVSVRNLTIKEILKVIEQEYSINFSYSDNILPNQSIDEFAFSNLPLSDVLNHLFKGTLIHYKYANDQIVLYLKKKQPVEYYISGFITDKLSGESLIGVNVFSSNAIKGVVTNSYGYYSLCLPANKHKLYITYLGYITDTLSFDLQNNINLNLKLQESSFLVEAIEIKGKTNENNVENNLMNVSTLQMQEINLLPGLFGENDVTRSIGLLAGIQTTEFSSNNVNVRGGSAEQTIFQMDEAKIYNASHFGGIFSVFNPDIVNSVEVFKGDIPVSGEGAISSLINVHLKEGNNQQWKLKGSLGLISAKASLEGPLKKDKSSVLIAFRRSYIDALIKVFNLEVDSSSTNFYFYDLNLKLNLHLNQKNRLYFSTYAGSDFLNLLSKLKRSNQMANVRWNHLFGPKLFSNSSIVLSRNHMEQYYFESGKTIFWDRTIYNLMTKVDFNYFLNSKMLIRFGLSFNKTDIKTYFIKTFYENDLVSSEKGPIEYLYTNSFYFNTEYEFSPQIILNTGARLNLFHNPNALFHNRPGNNFSESEPISEKESYTSFGFEPQVHLKYLINSLLAFKWGYKRQTNALHQLTVNDIGITVNRWMPSTRGFKPQVSNNYSFGCYYNKSNKFNFSTELYYRKMKNLVETLREERILFSYVPDKYLYLAEGRVVGEELSASLKVGNFTTILNYTYSDVKWKTAGINQNNYYPASHSHPHSLSIIGSYTNTKRLSVAATWVYYTGSPYTPISGKYILDNKEMVYFDNTKINSARLPAYHRLDLSLDIVGKKNAIRKWKSFWNFSIYNLYFQKNAYSLVYFSPGIINNENTDKLKLEPKYLYFYQFVPSITYRFEF